MFINIDDRYGPQEELTLEDYYWFNPEGDFRIVGDEIREYFSDRDGDFVVVACR